MRQELIIRVLLFILSQKQLMIKESFLVDGTGFSRLVHQGYIEISRHDGHAYLSLTNIGLEKIGAAQAI